MEKILKDTLSENKMLEMKISSFLLCCFFWGTIPTEDGVNCSPRDKESTSAFYELDIGGNQFNPLDWTITEPHNCPGNGQVSAIDIFKKDVYTIVEAMVAGNPAWAGKPKVNQFATGISAEMVAASSSLSDPYLASSGRSYYKRSN